MAKIIDFATRAIKESVDDVAKVVTNVTDDAASAAKTIMGRTEEQAKAINRKIVQGTNNLNKLQQQVGDKATAKSILRHARKSAASSVDDVAGGVNTETLSSTLSAKDSASVFSSATRDGKNGARIIGDSANSTLYVPTDGKINAMYDDLIKKQGFSRNDASIGAATGYAGQRENILRQEIENAKIFDSHERYVAAESYKNMSDAQRQALADEIYNARTQYDPSRNSNPIPQGKFDHSKVNGGSTAYRNDIEGRTQRYKETMDTARENHVLNGRTPEGGFGDTSALKSKRKDSLVDYKRWKESEALDQAFEDLKAGNMTDAVKQTGLKQGATTAEMDAFRQRHLAGITEQDVNFIDKMGYHDVPKKATAAAGTVWLVNTMSSRKGQQTNAELYGQRTPYR